MARLRWRLRGAWQWPTFVVALVGDTVLLHLLPPFGDGTGVAAAVLLALGVNLVTVGVIGPACGLLVRRLRPDLPRVVASNYAGTALLIVVAAALAALGVAHRPAVASQRRAFSEQAAAVRLYVLSQAPAYARGLQRADTWSVDTNLYRTCVPGSSAARLLCLIVNTASSPPGLTVDPDHSPNSSYTAPSHIHG
jgi:hypothetical protein